jgi:hypothetical protein
MLVLTRDNVYILMRLSCDVYVCDNIHNKSYEYSLEFKTIITQIEECCWGGVLVITMMNLQVP